MVFCFILKLKVTLFYLLSFVFICFTTPCHSLLLIVICYHSLSLVVICCHSLSFVVTQFVTRCHLFLLVVTHCKTWCHSLYHSLSFLVTRCTTRCLSFSLDVPLVCLFINNLNYVWCNIMHVDHYQHLLN